jgi:hypothetical protein
VPPVFPRAGVYGRHQTQHCAAAMMIAYRTLQALFPKLIAPISMQGLLVLEATAGAPVNAASLILL